MNLIYRMFRLNPDSREDVVAATSGIGIGANVLIAVIKMMIGLFASSIAIISEGANNAADALTSVLALVGTKLAKKHPDEKHPFGYGRIEYLTSLVIATLILVTGTEMLVSAVKLVIHPEPISISYVSIAIIAGSAIIKFFLGMYTIKMGKKTGSSALEAVGTESRNDSFASAITIISALIFLIFRFSVDAFAGILTSALIIKAGFDVLRDTISELIGNAGEHELALKLYKEIRNTDGILGAADMMLHNYGPDAWSGSVNIEIDHEKTVGEIYQIIHALQLRIMHEYAVTMVFGVYAVDNDHAEVKALRKTILEYVREKKHIKSFHAVYIEPETNKIYCDFIVDYSLKDWEELKKDFVAYMAEAYPDSELELTIETEFV